MLVINIWGSLNITCWVGSAYIVVKRNLGDNMTEDETLQLSDYYYFGSLYDLIKEKEDERNNGETNCALEQKRCEVAGW